jgi:ADP-ribosylglycohydrolase
MMQSFLFEPRKVQATEARLKAIFEAARLGLRGDTLALAAGMMPSEYRQLCQMDPVAEMAEAQGRAYSEMQAATIVDKAIAEGDAKMALDKLKHRHDWQAAQRVQIDVTQQISIVDAMALADKCVAQGLEYNDPVQDAPFKMIAKEDTRARD